MTVDNTNIPKKPRAPRKAKVIVPLRSTFSLHTYNAGELGHFQNIPLELIVMIFAYLPFKTLAFIVSCTCKSWRSLFSYPPLWKRVMGVEEALSVLPKIPIGSVEDFSMIGYPFKNKASHLNRCLKLLVKDQVASLKYLTLSGSTVTKKQIRECNPLFSPLLERLVLHNMSRGVDFKFIDQEEHDLFSNLTHLQTLYWSDASIREILRVSSLINNPNSLSWLENLTFFRVGLFTGVSCEIFQLVHLKMIHLARLEISILYLGDMERVRWKSFALCPHQALKALVISGIGNSVWCEKTKQDQNRIPILLSNIFSAFPSIKNLHLSLGPLKPREQDLHQMTPLLITPPASLKKLVLCNWHLSAESLYTIQAACPSLVMVKLFKCLLDRAAQAAVEEITVAETCESNLDSRRGDSWDEEFFFLLGQGIDLPHVSF